ncbi:class A beta-lactamase [soil metagenome]
MRLTRREALLGALALGGALAGCRQALAAPPPPPIDSGTDTDIAGLESRHRAQIAVWAVDLGSGATVTHRADQRFAMCSTFKTYAAARALQLAARRELDLDVPVPVSAADIVVDSPVTSTLVGGTITLAEACAAALTRSDNTAGNLVLRAIGGPQAITAFARGVGDDQTRLDRWEPDLNEAILGDPRDTTTARALCAGYRRVLIDDALDPPQQDRLLGWMRATATSDKRFRAGLPPGWTSADKTGAGAYGSTNDAGVLFGPTGERVVLAVLIRSSDDRKDTAPLNGAIADTVRLALTRLGYQ